MAIDEAESWTPVEWVINSVKVRIDAYILLFLIFWSRKRGRDWIGLATDGENKERDFCTLISLLAFCTF